ncbi:MAG: DegT/DnrJ/EryC1/StrS family aminotransferase [Cyanobacteria bacterium J06639_1]
MDKIPPVELTQQYRAIADELLPAVEAVISSGRYIGGQAVTTLESSLAQFLGCTEVVACNSGTDALYLAMRALDIGPGDEVLVPPFTFFASAESVSMTGARPVFADIEAETFNLDCDRLEAAITPRTKAIMPVHLFGQPANMTAVMEIAERYQLAVVEDCAQATGACWDGRQVGAIGHVGCFSFFPTKNLGGMGDGGAVSTSDPAIAAKVRVLKEHGSKERYYHEALGVNSRLDALQAAILNVKLPYLREWNWRRRSLAATYQALLADCPGIALPQGVKGGQSVWNQFTIRIQSDGSSGERRDRVKQALFDAGVISMIYYPVPIHLQEAYADLGHKPGDFPVSEQCAREVLSLPMFPELTYAQQKRVAEALYEALSPSAAVA